MLLRKVLVRAVRILFRAQHPDVAGQVDIYAARQIDLLPVPLEGDEAVAFFLPREWSFCVFLIKRCRHRDHAAMCEHIFDFLLIRLIIRTCSIFAFLQIGKIELLERQIRQAFRLQLLFQFSNNRLVLEAQKDFHAGITFFCGGKRKDLFARERLAGLLIVNECDNLLRIQDLHQAQPDTACPKHQVVSPAVPNPLHDFAGLYVPYADLRKRMLHVFLLSTHSSCGSTSSSFDAGCTFLWLSGGSS